MIDHSFTPVRDDLVQKMGLVRAAIFGMIWRYCQLEGGVCYASQTTIAKKLSISRRAVNLNLRFLVEHGYLVLEEKRPGHPDAYRLGSDVGNLDGMGEIESHNGCNPGLQGGEIESHNGCDPGLQGGVTESYNGCDPKLHEESLEETPSRENLRREEPRTQIPDQFDLLQSWIEELTGFPIPPTPENIAVLNELAALKTTREDIEGAVAWWSSVGKLARTPVQLKESIKTQIGKRTQSRARAPTPKEDYVNVTELRLRGE